MMLPTATRRSTLSFSCALLLVAFDAVAASAATPTVSIDFQGPTIGAPDPRSGRPLSEADLFGTEAARRPTGLATTAGGFLELDAVSSGRDAKPSRSARRAHRWLFSIDEHAVGLDDAPVGSPGHQGAVGETRAATAVFVARLGAGPIGPPTLESDAAGASARWPALDRLALPWVVAHVPTPRELPDLGDNVDALEADQSLGERVFFSLDSAFPDPFEPTPANTGSAIANGVVGGDVLVAEAGTTRVYARAAELGLDIDGEAADIDDLDALLLHDDGDGIYQPTTGPYSWRDGSTDMLLFSLRRGSASLGTIDALLGLPIEAGDILVPVVDACDGEPQVDGVDCDVDLGIFVAAEALGLATWRSGTAATGDDLDALDLASTSGSPIARR